MASTECLVCEAPLQGVWLCGYHRMTLLTMLGMMPGLSYELETTAARLDRMSVTVGSSGSGNAPPSIVNFDAAAVLTELRQTLLFWTHHARNAKARMHSFTIPEMARYLAAVMPDMLTTQPIGAMYTELAAIRRRAVQAVDLPPSREGYNYAGPCGAVFDNGTCNHQLWARHGATSIQCQRCETVWDVEMRRDNALLAAENEVATADAISRVFTAQNVKVTPNMIYLWKSRGKIRPAGTNKAGQPLYRIGDVMELLGWS